MAKNTKQSNRGIVTYIGVLLALIILASFFFSNAPKETSPFKYYEVVAFFQQDEVSEYELDLASAEITFKLRGKEEEYVYRLPYLGYFIDHVLVNVDEYNEENPETPVPYNWDPGQEYSWLLNLLPTAMIIVMMGLFWYFTLRQSKGGNVTGFGKAKTKNPEEAIKVTFKDVAGADEEKAELVEIVEFLKNPHKFNTLGARIPKGVLLLGPPGTGKTLLARAVAGEAGAPFFSISGSDFVEMFVGVGASRVRDLFDQAKKNAPSIIFIDEIDAVGRQRGAGLGGGHDEREQTLNQLLVEMDGFVTNSGVIVIAATNRRDILDPALLRPGRFDRQIVVSYPDVGGREAILKVHTRNKPIAPDVDLTSIAKTTVGFTGADLENILNEAALLAARANRKAITNADVQEATVKVIAGPEKRSKVITEDDKRLTAYHEAGHALCTYYVEKRDNVHQVSIIPRGMAGGYTLSLPKEDRSYRTRGEMFASVITLLGGRVAEELVLDDISTGASNDIQRATATARAMITQYGFSTKLGPILYGQDQGEVFLGRDISQGRNYSEGVASEIDNEIRSLIDRAYQEAKQILIDHRDQLELVTARLIECEKIEADEFLQLMTKGYIEETASDNEEVVENAEETAEVKEALVEEKVVEEADDSSSSDNQEEASEKAENSEELPSETDEALEQVEGEKALEEEKKTTDEQ